MIQNASCTAFQKSAWRQRAGHFLRATTLCVDSPSYATVEGTRKALCGPNFRNDKSCFFWSGKTTNNKSTDRIHPTTPTSQKPESASIQQIYLFKNNPQQRNFVMDSHSQAAFEKTLRPYFCVLYTMKCVWVMSNWARGRAFVRNHLSRKKATP